MGEFKIFSEDQISAARNKLQSIKEKSYEYDEPKRMEFIVKSLEKCSEEELLMMAGFSTPE